MAKLTTLRPQVQMLAPRIGRLPADEAARSQAKRDQNGHNLYNSRRWRGSDSKKGTDGLRYRVLVEANFICAMCNELEEDPRNLVADHIIPHKADPLLFFYRANLQCLCASCHSSRKQAMERRGER